MIRVALAGAVAMLAGVTGASAQARHSLSGAAGLVRLQTGPASSEIRGTAVSGTGVAVVDGKRVGEQATEGRTPENEPRLVDVEYRLPAEVVQGKTKVTVRFQAKDGSEVGTVCGIRMVRLEREA